MLRSRSRWPVLIRNATTAPMTRIASNPSRRMMRNDCQNASQPLPAGARERDDLGQRRLDRVAQPLGGAHVAAAHRRLEVGELPLHRRDEARDSSRAPASRAARTRCRRRTPCRPRRPAGRSARRSSDCSSSASTIAPRRVALSAVRCPARDARCGPSSAACGRTPPCSAACAGVSSRDGGIAVPGMPSRTTAASCSSLRSDLPRDGADLRRQLVSDRAQRAVAGAGHAVARRAALREQPLALELLRVRARAASSRTRRRSSAARASACRRSRPSACRRCRPTATRYISAGVTPRIVRAVPMAGGFGLQSTPPAGPSPEPARAVTARARLLRRSRCPSARFERLAGAARAWPRCRAAWRSAARASRARRRALGAHRRGDGVEQRARRRARSTPRVAPPPAWRRPGSRSLSWYSCALISLPCASTALPYSSTATLTMLATRRAGCSCAAAGTGDGAAEGREQAIGRAR